MTEIIGNKDLPPRRVLHWKRFAVAFALAPLVVTLPFIVQPIIAIYALIIGYPLYILLGLPTLIWHLRREPPRYLPIALLAAVAQLFFLPFALIALFFSDDTTVLAVTVGLTMFGIFFGVSWALMFTLIYRRLIRDL